MQLQQGKTSGTGIVFPERQNSAWLVVVILEYDRSSSTTVLVPDHLWWCCRLGSNVKLSWKLSSITKLDNGGYNLTYETPEGLVSLQSRSVVLTVPSHIASSLLHPLSVCLFLN